MKDVRDTIITLLMIIACVSTLVGVVVGIIYLKEVISVRDLACFLAGILITLLSVGLRSLKK